MNLENILSLKQQKNGSSKKSQFYNQAKEEEKSSKKVLYPGKLPEFSDPDYICFKIGRLEFFCNADNFFSHSPYFGKKQQDIAMKYEAEEFKNEKVVTVPQVVYRLKKQTIPSVLLLIIQHIDQQHSFDDLDVDTAFQVVQVADQLKMRSLERHLLLTQIVQMVHKDNVLNYLNLACERVDKIKASYRGEVIMVPPSDDSDQSEEEKKEVMSENSDSSCEDIDEESVKKKKSARPVQIYIPHDDEDDIHEIKDSEDNWCEFKDYCIDVVSNNLNHLLLYYPEDVYTKIGDDAIHLIVNKTMQFQRGHPNFDNRPIIELTMKIRGCKSVFELLKLEKDRILKEEEELRVENIENDSPEAPVLVWTCQSLTNYFYRQSDSIMLEGAYWRLALSYFKKQSTCLKVDFKIVNSPYDIRQAKDYFKKGDYNVPANLDVKRFDPAAQFEVELQDKEFRQERADQFNAANANFTNHAIVSFIASVDLFENAPPNPAKIYSMICSQKQPVQMHTVENFDLATFGHDSIELSLKFKVKELHSQILSFISKNFTFLLSDPEIRHLPKDDFKLLLKHKYLNVTQEDEVIKAICLWAEGQQMMLKHRKYANVPKRTNQFGGYCNQSSDGESNGSLEDKEQEFKHVARTISKNLVKDLNEILQNVNWDYVSLPCLLDVLRSEPLMRKCDAFKAAIKAQFEVRFDRTNQEAIDAAHNQFNCEPRFSYKFNTSQRNLYPLTCPDESDKKLVTAKSGAKSQFQLLYPVQIYPDFLAHLADCLLNPFDIVKSTVFNAAMMSNQMSVGINSMNNSAAQNSIGSIDFKDQTKRMQELKKRYMKQQLLKKKLEMKQIQDQLNAMDILDVIAENNGMSLQANSESHNPRNILANKKESDLNSIRDKIEKAKRLFKVRIADQKKRRGDEEGKNNSGRIHLRGGEDDEDSPRSEEGENQVVVSSESGSDPEIEEEEEVEEFKVDQNGNQEIRDRRRRLSDAAEEEQKVQQNRQDNRNLLHIEALDNSESEKASKEVKRVRFPSASDSQNSFVSMGSGASSNDVQSVQDYSQLQVRRNHWDSGIQNSMNCSMGSLGSIASQSDLSESHSADEPLESMGNDSMISMGEKNPSQNFGNQQEMVDNEQAVAMFMRQISKQLINRHKSANQIGNDDLNGDNQMSEVGNDLLKNFQERLRSESAKMIHLSAAQAAQWSQPILQKEKETQTEEEKKEEYDIPIYLGPRTHKKDMESQTELDFDFLVYLMDQMHQKIKLDEEVMYLRQQVYKQNNGAAEIKNRNETEKQIQNRRSQQAPLETSSQVVSLEIFGSKRYESQEMIIDEIKELSKSGVSHSESSPEEQSSRRQESIRVKSGNESSEPSQRQDSKRMDQAKENAIQKSSPEESKFVQDQVVKTSVIEESKKPESVEDVLAAVQRIVMQEESKGEIVVLEESLESGAFKDKNLNLDLSSSFMKSVESVTNSESSNNQSIRVATAESNQSDNQMGRHLVTEPKVPYPPKARLGRLNTVQVGKNGKKPSAQSIRNFIDDSSNVTRLIDDIFTKVEYNQNQKKKQQSQLHVLQPLGMSSTERELSSKRESKLANDPDGLLRKKARIIKSSKQLLSRVESVPNSSSGKSYPENHPPQAQQPSQSIVRSLSPALRSQLTPLNLDRLLPEDQPQNVVVKAAPPKIHKLPFIKNSFNDSFDDSKSYDLSNEEHEDSSVSGTLANPISSDYYTNQQSSGYVSNQNRSGNVYDNILLLVQKRSSLELKQLQPPEDEGGNFSSFLQQDMESSMTPAAAFDEQPKSPEKPKVTPKKPRAAAVRQHRPRPAPEKFVPSGAKYRLPLQPPKEFNAASPVPHPAEPKKEGQKSQLSKFVNIPNNLKIEIKHSAQRRASPVNSGAPQTTKNAPVIGLKGTPGAVANLKPLTPQMAKFLNKHKDTLAMRGIGQAENPKDATKGKRANSKNAAAQKKQTKAAIKKQAPQPAPQQPVPKSKLIQKKAVAQQPQSNANNLLYQDLDNLHADEGDESVSVSMDSSQGCNQENDFEPVRSLKTPKPKKKAQIRRPQSNNFFQKSRMSNLVVHQPNLFNDYYTPPSVEEESDIRSEDQSSKLTSNKFTEEEKGESLNLNNIVKKKLAVMPAYARKQTITQNNRQKLSEVQFANNLKAMSMRDNNQQRNPYESSLGITSVEISSMNAPNRAAPGLIYSQKDQRLACFNILDHLKGQERSANAAPSNQQSESDRNDIINLNSQRNGRFQGAPDQHHQDLD